MKKQMGISGAREGVSSGHMSSDGTMSADESACNNTCVRVSTISHISQLNDSWSLNRTFRGTRSTSFATKSDAPLAQERILNGREEAMKG